MLMRATPHRCFYNPHFDPPTNTFNRKTSNMMRPLSRSRTCTSHHSHSYITLPVQVLLADDRQTEDGGDSVFFVSVGVPRDYSPEASKPFI